MNVEHQRHHGSRGQALVEFALVAPLLILILLLVVDFGRAYMGWVQLNNAARVAANYAALHPYAWGSPGNAAQRTAYATLIANDTAGSNCAAPVTPPPPEFSGGTSLGAQARVDLHCDFQLIVAALPGFRPAASQPDDLASNSLLSNPLRRA